MEERVLVQGRDSWVAVMSGMIFLVGVFFCCWSGGWPLVWIRSTIFFIRVEGYNAFPPLYDFIL